MDLVSAADHRRFLDSAFGSDTQSMHEFETYCSMGIRQVLADAHSREMDLCREFGDEFLQLVENTERQDRGLRMYDC